METPRYKRESRVILKHEMSASKTTRKHGIYSSQAGLDNSCSSILKVKLAIPKALFAMLKVKLAIPKAMFAML